ncbi:hypothetical protein LZ554_007668 [Drepanopeziza brunnea f. sp. 'monogermtubi']|nr:hypothetical protein LZ554_007668 [Drepanopeziza brunnea f. sp. 'monogermtubi']
MKFFLACSAALFGLLLSPTTAQKYAFAHMVVGNTAAHTQDTWAQDITLARNTGFDAFVLNIAYPDPNIYGQVANAFAAAEAAGSAFKLFFAFDYLGGGQTWPATGDRSVVSYLNQYKNSPAYFRYNGVPLVSTFEGRDNTDDWAQGGIIRSAVGGIWFVPDWTSFGPTGFAQHLNKVEGAFNWDMWPIGASDVNTDLDNQWRSVLGSKSYMMGISPWFFHSADSPKKWVWRGDDSWALRWTQAINFGAPFIQIVTWNDWGESSYVGPLRSTNEIPAGSGIYVDGQSHESWLDFLPYYIAKYKGSAFTVSRDQMQYWYRTAPAAAGSTCGVVGGDSSQDNGVPEISPNSILLDKIFFTALLSSPAQVHVQIGANPETVYSFGAGITHQSLAFNGQTGAPRFWVTRNGVTTGSGTGKAITAGTALPGGCTNYNPWVGSF